jgi:hypothetical protein
MIHKYFALRTLCEIKFIPPFKVTKWKADIYPQPDADFLICFRDSTVSAQRGLCWTKCHIIPDWADPGNDFLQCFEKRKEMQVRLYNFVFINGFYYTITRCKHFLFWEI